MFGFGIGCEILVHFHGCLKSASFWQNMYRAETYFSLVCISGYVETQPASQPYVRISHPVIFATCIALPCQAIMCKLPKLNLHKPIGFKWQSLERTDKIVCKHICNSTLTLITTMMQQVLIIWTILSGTSFTSFIKICSHIAKLLRSN